MNITVYLFGKFNNGYTQYPDDSTSGIFGQFHRMAKSTTQIAIHRDGNLMYYGYIRKLEQDKYIGLCVVLNGLLLTRIDNLFSLFENIISGLATKGYLIHFNEQGTLVTNVEKLYPNKEEIDLLSESLRAGFSRLDKDTKPLPAVSYGVSKDSSKDFAISDDSEEIIKSSHANGYTYIYKSRGFDTAQMNSYQGVLTRISNENKELQDKLATVEAKNKKILRQKKQFKFVAVLLVVLLIGGIGSFSLYDNLNITRKDLSHAKNAIGRLTDYTKILQDSIGKQNILISDILTKNHGLEQSLQAEEALRIEAESNLETLRDKITKRQPFIVKNTSFNFRTGYLSIYYYGMIEGWTTIKARACNDNGPSYTGTSTIYVVAGDNSASVYISNNLNRDKWYSFEVLMNNVILGGDRH